MFDKTVNFYLLALKFFPDWFVTIKIIEKLDNTILLHFLAMIKALIV